MAKQLTVNDTVVNLSIWDTVRLTCFSPLTSLIKEMRKSNC